MLKKWFIFSSKVVLTFCLCSCTTHTSQVENVSGTPTTYEDESSPSEIGDVGFESQDIVSLTDKMMRDIMANPFWGVAEEEEKINAPRIIVDAGCFTNEGGSDINLNMITDRLRVELNRSAKGRLIFLARHLSQMVENERKLKDEGVVDNGSREANRFPMGSDYRLCGNITSLDKIFGEKILRYTQIALEIVNLDSGALAWSGISSFKKLGTLPIEKLFLGPERDSSEPGYQDKPDIQVWTDKKIYRVGDKLSIHFQSNWDCYVYLYHESEKGGSILIFPNRYDANNFVKGGRVYTIPDETYGFEFSVTPPLGVESIKVLATSNPKEAEQWRTQGMRGIVAEAKKRVDSLTYRVVR